MPIVPSSKGPQVNPNVSPDARLSLPGIDVPDMRINTPTLQTPQIRNQQVRAASLRPALKDPSALRAPQLGDGGARQLVAAGEALQDVGGVLGKAVLDYRQRVNATVVDDAVEQAREEARRLTYGKSDGKGGLVGGYRQIKGYDTLKRESGKGLDDEVSEAFDASVREIAKSRLTNADQQAAFQQQVGALGQQLRQGAQIWASEQYDAYEQSVYGGMIKNRAEGFALVDPDSEVQQQQAMAELEGAVNTLAVRDGLSAQELQVRLRDARGTAVTSMFNRLIADGQYKKAQAILNTWSKTGPDGLPLIDGNAAAKMKAAVDGRVKVQVGEQLADEGLRTLATPAYNPQPLDRVQGVINHLETRGRHVDPKTGRVITSPKGAFGIGQLMPETAEKQAKKLGRPELAELARQPTKEGEAANLLLARAEINDLMVQFKGDTEKVLAAYNAGPGWLVGGKDSKGRKIEGALRIAARTGTDWRTHLPQETQDYIRNGVSLLGQGGTQGGAPAKPKKADLYDYIDRRTDDHDAREAGYARVDKMLAAMDYDEREGHENAFAQALDKVQRNGGDVNSISPEEWGAMDPKDRATLRTYGKNIVEGAYRTDDPTGYWDAITAANDPNTTPAQMEAFRPRLSEGTFNLARQAYIAARKPEKGQAPTDLDYGRVDSLIDLQLQSRMVNTKPNKGNMAEVARMSGIRQFSHQWLINRQQAAGKKFNDLELEREVSQLFTRNQDFKSVWLFGANDKSVNVMTAQLQDIPPETRTRIVDQLQKALKRAPKPHEILGAYYRSQFYGNATRTQRSATGTW